MPARVKPRQVPFHLGERLILTSDLLHGPRFVVEIVAVIPGEITPEQAERASWSLQRRSQ